MNVVKMIFGTLFVCLLALFWGLVLFCGVLALAAGDYFRRLGRRCGARLRGERFGPARGYNPTPCDGPRLFMDADGFVEPPESRPVVYPGLRLVAMSEAPVLLHPHSALPQPTSPRSYAGYAASNCQSPVFAKPRNVTSIGTSSSTSTSTGTGSGRSLGSARSVGTAGISGTAGSAGSEVKVLQFPREEAVRDRLRAVRRTKDVVVSKGSGNVVYLSFKGRSETR